MDQMVVYRVECPKSRLGMYFSSSFAHQEMSTRTQHPGPTADNRLMLELQLKKTELGAEEIRFNRACRFGFASKKQMRDWISEDDWKRKLADEGLIVAKYQVPKEQVAIGQTQAIFHPMHAKLVSTMCPTKI
jgi:hypothetical protein